MDNSDKQNINKEQGNFVGRIGKYFLSLINKKQEITEVLSTQNILDSLSQEDSLKYIGEHVKDFQGLGRTIWSLKLGGQLPEFDPTDSPYLYRGIKIDLKTLNNIITKEGLQVDKTGENDAICFTMRRPWNSAVIGHAFTSSKQLSVIFQIPIPLLEKYGIEFSAGGDNVKISKDIPAELIKQTNIFLIDYKNNTLVQIKPNFESQPPLDSSEKEKIVINDSVSDTIDKEDLKNPLSKSYKATNKWQTSKTTSHGLNRVPWGIGSGKTLIEGVKKQTLGGEKLSLIQSKLYILGSSISLLGWAGGYLAVYYGNPRLATTLAPSSIMSSIIIGLAQASVINNNLGIGELFKLKLSEYLDRMKSALGKLENKKNDEKTQEEIHTAEKYIDEVQKVVDGMSNEEAGKMVKEIIKDLPVTGTNEK